MTEPKASSLGSKWLILVVISTIAATSLVFAFLTGMLSPTKVEKIYFDNCEWSQNISSGDITSVNIYIANTGPDELIINRVWVNETLLGTSEWECFLSTRLKAGDQAMLRITPSLIVFRAGSTYKFTIETAAGNTFPYTATAKSYIFMTTEQITFTNFSWGPSNTHALMTVKNTGTSDFSIAAVKVDGAPPAAITPSLATPYLLTKGNSITFNMTRTGAFISGVSYEFTVTTSKGNSFGPYTRTAP